MSTTKDKKKKKSKLPEQKLGDTPVPPWEMPTPEEKAKAKPVGKALKKALAKVESPEKADEVIQQLEASTAGESAADVESAQPRKVTAGTAAERVETAVEAAPESQKAERALEMAARVTSTKDARSREAIAEAAQEVLNPEQQGATPSMESDQEREFLRRAVLKRLKPLDALDASLFLAINHLSHTRLLNTLFYGLTLVFNGAAAWHIIMGLIALRRRKPVSAVVREMTVPLIVTTSLVEYPIKPYFKRRRPFISVIQAIVIGKKPGTWSFPSGHAAGAFAGAWLLNRVSPKWGPLRYLIAGLVAFSRIYLGDHYPGDVLSGSLFGLLFAKSFHWLTKSRRK